MKKQKIDTYALATAIYDGLADLIARLPDDTKTFQPDQAIVIIEGCLNSRTGQWRKTKPKGNHSALLWQFVKFFRGNGSLWGYPWFADADTKDKAETLALVLLRGQSSAMDNWRRVLGGRA